MPYRVGEKIRVAAVFEPGTPLRPVWFDWSRKKHTVAEVTCTWTSREGNVAVLHFAVSDGTALYELAYDTAAQSWTLNCIDVE